MSLTVKAALVFAMMIFAGILTIFAHRRNYDKFRNQHSRRKYRVPLDQIEQNQRLPSHSSPSLDATSDLREDA